MGKKNPISKTNRELLLDHHARIARIDGEMKIIIGLIIALFIYIIFA